jgi:hypothetical protein
MFCKICLIAAGLLAGTGAAFGATFTYTSQPLQEYSEGGNGAKQVVISFLGNPPAPGKCTLTQKVTYYHDVVHTLGSMKRNGFALVKSVVNDLDKKVRLTYANVCMKRDRQTVTGQYQIYFTYANSVVTDYFYANNLAYTVPGDLVELDEYLGGEVPQVYSNASNTQGTWTITP